MSAPTQSETERGLQRWALQAAARELMPHESVAYCLRKVLPSVNHVGVKRNAARQRAWYTNLFRCASVWMCPICSAKITERRRAELTQALAENPQLEARMLTLTLSHKKEDKLKELLRDLIEAYRWIKSTKKWAKFEEQFGLVGSVRGLENTWRPQNGFHPHLHVLMFFPVGQNLRGVRQWWEKAWEEALDRKGRTMSYDRGVDFSSAREAIEKYVAKFGREPLHRWGLEHEIAKAASKLARGEKGRSPMQLLFDYMQGDKQAGKLWSEYAATFKGRNQLTWSRGLRKKLGLDRELTDKELEALELMKGDDFSQIKLEDWKLVCGGRGIARGELLRIAGTGDVAKFYALLERLRQVHAARS